MTVLKKIVKRVLKKTFAKEFKKFFKKNIKKTCSVIMLMLSLFAMYSDVLAFNNIVEINEDEIYNNDNFSAKDFDGVKTVFANAGDVNVSAKSAILMCADSGSIVWAKNENAKVPMASTTKIMTSIIALEQIETFGNKQIEITDSMVLVEGTSMGLMPRDVVTLDTLVKGAMMCSGNDAANAIAMSVAGGAEEFALMMNEKARQIGMNNSLFVTPSGLDKGGHHSTAYDMALLGAYAMENENFKAISSQKSMMVNFVRPQKRVRLKGHNKLLSLYDGCIGIKTGFTKAAGRCLVSCAERDGIRLIAVTLNAPDDWSDHKKLFDYGFANAAQKTFDDKTYKCGIPVNYGLSNCLELACESSFTKTLNKNDINKVVRTIELPESIDAPIHKGQVVGKITYSLNDKIIGKNDIVANSDIEAKKVPLKFFGKIKRFFVKFFKLKNKQKNYCSREQ